MWHTAAVPAETASRGAAALQVVESGVFAFDIAPVRKNVVIQMLAAAKARAYAAASAAASVTAAAVSVTASVTTRVDCFDCCWADGTMEEGSRVREVRTDEQRRFSTDVGSRRATA